MIRAMSLLGQARLLLAVVALALPTHAAAMAISTLVTMRLSAESILRDVVVSHTLAKLPGHAAAAARWHAALLKFDRASAQAGKFFATTGRVGHRAVSSQEMRAMNLYANQGKALLQVRP